MSRFDDAARVSRQRASASVKNENLSRKDREDELQKSRQNSLVLSVKNVGSVDENNGDGNSRLMNSKATANRTRTGRLFQQNSRQNSQFRKTESRLNESENRGHLIQSRKEPKGIDPNFLGIAVKPPTNKISTAGTAKTQTDETFYDDDDEDYDDYEGYEEEYEDEEDDEEYSPDYLYFLTQQQQAKQDAGPRVQIDGGAEPCGCFPHRSNKLLPSMLYEKIKCKHSNVIGHAHPGVYKFDSNWNEFYENPVRKKKSNPPPKTKFMFGYPKPTFIDLPESAGTEGTEQEEFYDGEEYEGDEYWDYYKDDDEFQESPEPHWEEDPELPGDTDDIEDLFHEEEIKSTRTKKPRTAKKKKESKSDNILSELHLPQIGYSPPPSRDRSRLSVRSQPYSLPPLPESPYLAASVKDDRHALSSARTDAGYTEYGNEYSASNLPSRKQQRSAPSSRLKTIRRTLGTPRRFQGKFYDSVLNKTLTYDIVPRYQMGANDWKAYKGEGTARRRGSRESRMPSKGYTATGSRQRSAQILEEEDDDYEDDENYDEASENDEYEDQ